MALEPLNVLFGAAVALLGKEAVDARKQRRKLRAEDDAHLRGIKQELHEIRTVTLKNLVALWDRDEIEWSHRHAYLWETDIDPLSPLPVGLEGLMRQDSSNDFPRNSQVTSLLSHIVASITHTALIDAQRMRFLAAQYRARVVHPNSQNEVAERVERWERKLLGLHMGLLSSVLHMLAIVEVVEADRLDIRRFRVIRFGTFYEPDEHDWEALQQLLRENDSSELSRGAGGHHSRFSVLEDFGLAEFYDGLRFITARGRIAVGSGEKIWRRPRSPDPSEERIDWSTFNPIDPL